MRNSEESCSTWNCDPNAFNGSPSSSSSSSSSSRLGRTGVGGIAPKPFLNPLSILFASPAGVPKPFVGAFSLAPFGVAAASASCLNESEPRCSEGPPVVFVVCVPKRNPGEDSNFGLFVFCGYDAYPPPLTPSVSIALPQLPTSISSSKEMSTLRSSAGIMSTLTGEIRGPFFSVVPSSLQRVPSAASTGLALSGDTPKFDGVGEVPEKGSRWWWCRWCCVSGNVSSIIAQVCDTFPAWSKLAVLECPRLTTSKSKSPFPADLVRMCPPRLGRCGVSFMTHDTVMCARVGNSEMVSNGIVARAARAVTRRGSTAQATST
mmetsp:Transcript_579/g.2220  ORF Transcript_579/g.2220 Transcript_579/m.2220 type:complete len:319 (+) Transcript_579:5116-6072(+)